MMGERFNLKTQLKNANVSSCKAGRKKFIDLSAAPFLPPLGWLIHNHVGEGLFTFDSSKVFLLPATGSIKAQDLIEDLAGRSILNANVLDWLLANADSIPEDWTGKYVYFVGTVYCRNNHDSLVHELHIRCLYWNGSRWCDGDGWLGRKLNSNSFVAIAE